MILRLLRHFPLLILLGLTLSRQAAAATESYGGRDMIVYVPAALPAEGARALVVVLHGGMGNAQRIESAQAEKGLGMDGVAEKNGFIVAYLNGTRAARLFGGNMLAWNAGTCCGLPEQNDVDDAGYIEGAVDYLIAKYGIDRDRVYGMGHSNGAMMTQRLMCETGLFAAAVPISGPLMLRTANCPAARGKRILAIHGAEDENVPIAGGKGKGISNATFSSEDHTKQVFTESGASYDLQIVPGADHRLDDIDQVIRKAEGRSIAEKAAGFFGLLTSR
jgi:polyhydroxybutyrate depolymerase